MTNKQIAIILAEVKKRKMPEYKSYVWAHEHILRTTCLLLIMDGIIMGDQVWMNIWN
jgi:hypothetical protein